MPLRIGIDIGGTFTDLVADDNDTGQDLYTKAPTTAKGPASIEEYGSTTLVLPGGTTWRSPATSGVGVRPRRVGTRLLRG